MRSELIAIVVVVVAWTPAAAQEVIPDRETCPGCTLELREVRRLGDRPGQELYADIHRWLVEDEAGRIWVPNVGAGSGHLIQVYGDDGQYVDFSRRGEGPGEFEMVNMMMCVGNRILLLERGRFTFIDPTAWTSTFAFRSEEAGYRRAMNGVRVGDSLIWMASPSRHPDYLGYPILALDLAEERVVEGYGKEVEHYDRNVERMLGRYLVALGPNRIASVNEWSYEIRVHASNGSLLRHFVRDAPWFRPGGANDPMVLVAGARALDPHTLAILLLERDPDVEVVLEGPDEATQDEKWNSIVEVLDLRQGEVLRRIRVPHAVVGTVCPTDRIAALALGGDFPIDHLRIYDMVWVDGR